MALTNFWSKRADQKFDKIIKFLGDEWGETSTKVFVRKVYDFLELLQEFPEIGTLENKETNIRGFVIVKQLTLFYKIDQQKIILLNFFDNRMNPKKRKY
jgi:plasmid stabilization system protein ParE